MNGQYLLYGSYASYYTAKTRSYLRKKGIPFAERLPSDPQFREKVRPGSGSARIPQLLTPDNIVLQDSVTILDFLELRFPELPAIPTTPCQRVFVHLMELLASEGLLQLAWKHRWLFDENLRFVKMDFGRSFRPQGSDEVLMKYGNMIADRMMRHGLPQATESVKTNLDQQYLGLLAVIENHLVEHPYFLGGHPSAADYAIMGALHAHLGRDPAGLRLMQDNAPRVFRWIEHMIVPEVQSPEFFNRAIDYPADDQVPDTAMRVLHYICDHFGQQFVLDALAFNQVIEEIKPASGHIFDKDQDQPLLANQQIDYKGTTYPVRGRLYAVWLLQRSQRYFQSLGPDNQARVNQMLGESLSRELVSVPVKACIERINNRLVAA